MRMHLSANGLVIDIFISFVNLRVWIIVQLFADLHVDLISHLAFCDTAVAEPLQVFICRGVPRSRSIAHNHLNQLE